MFPASGGFPERPGPYTFADERQAGAFVTDAVEALMYLGCAASTIMPFDCEAGQARSPCPRHGPSAPSPRTPA